MAENESTIRTVRCSAPGCEEIRREVNGWFLCYVENGMFLSHPYIPGVALKSNQGVACGQAHAGKLYESYLNKCREEEMKAKS
jgi:hypothetical protein